MWFLNGRPLRDKLLSRVLKDSYRGFLVDGRQPVAFLSLSVDPAQVDVNVHPAKAEVRFRDERRLFGFLVHHLREAVSATDMSTPGEALLARAERRGAWEAALGSTATPVMRWATGESSAPGVRELPVVREVEPTRPQSPLRESEPASEPADLPLMQIAKTYIV